jgi:hypothetical protein
LAITSLVVQNWCPIVWNIHRVNLEYLPIVEGDILGRQASTIGFNSFLSFSDREHALLAQKPVKNMLVAPKDTISQILVKILNSAPERVFSLSDPGNGGVYTVLYLNGIRMDLASHTYVVDACVLPLTEKLLRGPLGHHITAISSHGVKVLTPGAEVEAWKHLLVAFTERCRTWTHKTTCKYTVSGKIPVSTEISQNPLCGCGEGIYLDRLSLDMRWKPLAPLMTRAAISPLFAIPYLETVDQRLEKLTCAACGKPEFATKSKLLKCSRCKEVDYCGKACQVAHWKEHKKVCKSK